MKTCCNANVSTKKQVSNVRNLLQTFSLYEIMTLFEMLLQTTGRP